MIWRPARPPWPPGSRAVADRSGGRQL